MASLIHVEIIGRPRGRMLYRPASITEAWYAAGCPPKFPGRPSGVSRREWVGWRLACAVKGWV